MAWHGSKLWGGGPSLAAALTEGYLVKLLRIEKRESSLLVRTDSRGLHDTTYVLGKKLLKIRVRTLNCSLAEQNHG